MSFEIREKRLKDGSLHWMEVTERRIAEQDRGPAEDIRSLRATRNEKGWQIEVVGPRGGPQFTGTFSSKAVRTFFQRLSLEL